MLDPRDLYEIRSELDDLGRPILIEAMTGVVDAGGAVGLASEHLTTTLDHERIVTFDVDQLMDYRSRRPPMVFYEDHWESYEDPVLAIELLRDEAGTPFLLLSGPEPDLHWKRFTSAVRTIMKDLGVQMSVGLNAIPMAVPHTRPCGVTAHATRKELLVGNDPWIRRVSVPGSAGHLLEYELGRAGADAMGFAAHVPHYLAQATYPAATEALLSAVSRATGLLLPLDGLRSAALEVRGEIDSQIKGGGEAADVVKAIEEQYDAFHRGREGTNLPVVDGDEPLPTGDELGAELERFLAEQSEPGGPQPG
ncbi:Predicted ATP-dependent carboligase, ATP-grasp superfamily [Parafrankia irregularis]|uniref:Predicted ATP-dependent carboligase, ATP-grasp superfamily n=1 Tax=Parafrankia irregularis TaxID=795642 RepID=A0A0S4QFD6_9ACTN|nr:MULTISPECIES: PAC2 family protein [Parafrankia]MBE3199464.1 PAC2 family protein [Parafrankia sp. CH37]CUU53874.1 Predicted ATP-dependent carboligase, ATP-grasp superfamily [Parafrankia irregularis]